MSCDVNSIHVHSRHTYTCLDRENDDTYIYMCIYIYIFLVRIIYKIYLTGHRSIVKLDESSKKFHDSLLFKASIIDLIITKYVN